MPASADQLIAGTAVPFECPHCGVFSQHSRITLIQGHAETATLKITGDPGDAPLGGWRYTANLTHHLVRCVNCEKDTYFAVRSKTGTISSTAPPPFPPQVDAAFRKLSAHEIAHQHPLFLSATHPVVPTSVKSASVEAEKCLAVGAPNACGTMTRRAIHSLCADRGAEGRDLFAQLKDLKTKQLITLDLYDWADSLRVLGRDSAHPKFPEVTAEDAEDGVRLLREIVKYVYILPYERAEKRRGK
jgi:hypothetical protein